MVVFLAMHSVDCRAIFLGMHPWDCMVVFLGIQLLGRMMISLGMHFYYHRAFFLEIHLSHHKLTFLANSFFHRSFFLRYAFFPGVFEVGPQPNQLVEGPFRAPFLVLQPLVLFLDHHELFLGQTSCFRVCHFLCGK